MAKLTGKIDEIINLIIDGISYRDISKKYNVGLSTLHDYLSKSEHSARVQQALEYSASAFDEKGEEILLNIKPKSTMIEMQRARELAQYYKWKAAKRFPRKYGDKLDHTTDGEKINTPLTPPTINIITGNAPPLADNESDVKI